jgi:hypothetical protein
VTSALALQFTIRDHRGGRDSAQRSDSSHLGNVPAKSGL